MTEQTAELGVVADVVTLAETEGIAVCAAPLADPWAQRHLALCLRNQEDLTPHARLLMEHVLEAAARPG